jgi:hypothetical protein
MRRTRTACCARRGERPCCAAETRDELPPSHFRPPRNSAEPTALGAAWEPDRRVCGCAVWSVPGPTRLGPSTPARFRSWGHSGHTRLELVLLTHKRHSPRHRVGSVGFSASQPSCQRAAGVCGPVMLSTHRRQQGFTFRFRHGPHATLADEAHCGKSGEEQQQLADDSKDGHDQSPSRQAELQSDERVCNGGCEHQASPYEA